MQDTISVLNWNPRTDCGSSVYMEREKNEQPQRMPEAFDPLQETNHEIWMKSGFAWSKNW